MELLSLLNEVEIYPFYFFHVRLEYRHTRWENKSSQDITLVSTSDLDFPSSRSIK